MSLMREIRLVRAYRKSLVTSKHYHCGEQKDISKCTILSNLEVMLQSVFT